MKRQSLDIVLLACTGLLLLAVYLGLKEFHLNDQAWAMWENYGNDPLWPLLGGHPHGLRYLVYYPSFAVADLIGLPADLVFTYVCVAALFLLSVCAGCILAELWGRENGYFLKRSLVTVAIFALAALMNGRMILPFLGYLLVTFVGVTWLHHRRWHLGHVIALTIGILLTSLSSGTLVVAMAMAAGIAVVTALRDLSQFVRAPHLSLSIALVLLLFAAPTAIGIGKNLAFYGGGGEGVVRMLNHGSGGDILQTLGENVNGEDAQPQGMGEAILQYWWIALLIWAGVAWLVGWRPVRMVLTAPSAENIMQLAVALTFAGGLFGYSVLTMGFVPLMILNSGNVVAALDFVRGRITALSAPRRT